MINNIGVINLVQFWIHGITMWLFIQLIYKPKWFYGLCEFFCKLFDFRQTRGRLKISNHLHQYGEDEWGGNLTLLS